MFYDGVFRLDLSRHETGGLCGRLGGAGDCAGNFGFESGDGGRVLDRIRAWMSANGLGLAPQRQTRGYVGGQKVVGPPQYRGRGTPGTH